MDSWRPIKALWGEDRRLKGSGLSSIFIHGVASIRFPSVIWTGLGFSLSSSGGALDFKSLIPLNLFYLSQVALFLSLFSRRLEVFLTLQNRFFFDIFARNDLVLFSSFLGSNRTDRGRFRLILVFEYFLFFLSTRELLSVKFSCFIAQIFCMCFWD